MRYETREGVPVQIPTTRTVELSVIEAPLADGDPVESCRTKLLELARKNRDRARDLSKIGGAAVREMQQAETDYVTADGEHIRADNRLRQIGVNPEAEATDMWLTPAA